MEKNAKPTLPPSPPPLIGVLCIDVAEVLLDMFPHDDILSYIPASYVKFIEGAGAEAVPVWIGRNRGYYENILQRLNGLLIPGGAVNFLATANCKLPNDCVQASKYIFEVAKKLNDDGVYFPIWGTCLGFQLIIYHSAKGEQSHQIRVECEHMNRCLPISFEINFEKSKMFIELPRKLKEIMETEDFGYHYHRFCITRQAIERFQIDREWKILATNKDENGVEFITLVEHERYPFFGSQVHLERNAFEIMGGEIDKCTHTVTAMQVSQYFANFFISEAKKCPNRCDEIERSRYSIRNFKAKPTHSHPGSHWLECYVFSGHQNYPQQIM